MIKYVDLDIALTLGFIGHDSGPSLGQLREGGLFKENDDLQIVVGLPRMDQRMEYAADRSCFFLPFNHVVFLLIRYIIN